MKNTYKLSCTLHDRARPRTLSATVFVGLHIFLVEYGARRMMDDGRQAEEKEA